MSNLKIIKSLLVTVFIVLNCSTSWSGVIGQGIWCQPKFLNSASDKKGFFFFDDIKVGSFSLYEPKIQNHRIHFTDLSIYKSNQNTVSWASLVYDHELSVFTKYVYELDLNSLALKYFSDVSKETKILNCIIYSEYNSFIKYEESS